MSKKHKEKISDEPYEPKKIKGVGTAAYPYEGGVISEDQDMVLVQNLDAYSKRGHVSISKIVNPPKECTPSEISWLKKFRAIRNSGVQGLILDHRNKSDVSTKLQEMTGLLIRNDLDGVFLSVQEVLTRLKDDLGGLDHTVLLIPNFFTTAVSNGRLPSWQINLLQGLLVSRGSNSKTTILGVESMDVLYSEYGSLFHSYLTSNYHVIAKGEKPSTTKGGSK